MIEGSIIRNQEKAHFITATVVDWIDVFTRQIYRDCVIDSFNYCIANKEMATDGYLGFNFSTIDKKYEVFNKNFSSYIPNFSVIPNPSYNPGGDFYKWFWDFQTNRNGRYGWVELGTLSYGQWEE